MAVRERSAYLRAYREANRERLAANDRAYREANADRLAGVQRARYERNRDRIIAQKATYRAVNRERINADTRAHRREQREELLEFVAEYHNNGATEPPGPRYILKGCPRCRGDLAWQESEGCYGCFQCGARV